MVGNGKENGCALECFEKNAYFFGKLMTARDMVAEQAVNEGKLYAVNRLILGSGQACGLQISEPKGTDDGLTINVYPGMALDCCGRLVIVDGIKTKAVKVEKPYPGTVYLYLQYSECTKEAVPVPGKAGCKEDCCYNRILETFDVVYEEAAPAYQAAMVKYPTSSTPAGSWDHWTIARDYYKDNLLDSNSKFNKCKGCANPRVFLGALRYSGSTWSIDADTTSKLRPVIYDNTMLYDIIAGHATDFNNPHGTTAAQAGALKSVDGVQNPGGDVDLRSSDNTVSITPNDTDNFIDIKASADLLEMVDIGNKSVAQYVLDKTLKYKLAVYRELGKTCGHGSSGEVIGQIGSITKKAVDERAYANPEAYLEAMGAIAKKEMLLNKILVRQLGPILENHAEPLLLRYSRAVKALNDAISDVKETAPKKALIVAVLQDEACEKAEFIAQALEAMDVPRVVGIDEEKATKTLTDAGFRKGGVKSIRADPEAYPTHTVAAQVPLAGTHPLGIVVDLYMSDHVSVRALVPGLLERQEKDAIAMLEKVGLGVNVVYGSTGLDDKVGIVDDQEPAEGSILKVHDFVTIRVLRKLTKKPTK